MVVSLDLLFVVRQAHHERILIIPFTLSFGHRHYGLVGAGFKPALLFLNANRPAIATRHFSDFSLPGQAEGVPFTFISRGRSRVRAGLQAETGHVIVLDGRKSGGQAAREPVFAAAETPLNEAMTTQLTEFSRDHTR